MKKSLKCGALSLVVSAAMTFTVAAETVKVGVIAPFSGPFAIWGKQFQEAIEVYQATHGTSVGDTTIEVIYRDSGGPKPDQAKALAQELLIREQVDYLGGFVFTPNALAVAPLLDRAEKPAVIFNARDVYNHRAIGFFRAHRLYPMASHRTTCGVGACAGHYTGSHNGDGLWPRP